MSAELVYYAKDWPHGLQCMDCNHLFADGDPYSERLGGFAGDTPIVEIVCVPCAMAVAK